MKIVKHKSLDKVDGAVALIMALGEWMDANYQSTKKSVYEERGILEI